MPARVLDGDVAIWHSETYDIWGPVTPPSTWGQHHNTFAAAKRALYIMLQHAEDCKRMNPSDAGRLAMEAMASCCFAASACGTDLQRAQ